MLKNKQQWIVQKQQAGFKLLAFLTCAVEGVHSNKFLKRLIDQNRCEVNGKTERFASTPVYEGDSIVCYFDDPIPSHQTIDPARIIFEDDSLLIYNKPSGLACDEKGILLLFPQLKLVHRLDRDTTGLLIFAKNDISFQNLVKQFKEYKVKKKYLAIVDGQMTKPQGKIENYLGKQTSFSGQTVYGATTDSKGLYACTEWTKLKVQPQASLLACYPKTGRTHQIRVHLAESGHPLLSDFQYGKKFRCAFRPTHYLLHAESLSFFHPVTGEELHLTVPPPKDFQVAVKSLFSKLS